MSSLIAIKVKTNMCLVSLKLFIVLTILFANVQTCTTYTTITTTINAIYNVDFPTTTFVHTQLHTRLIEFLLTISRFSCTFIYARLQSDEDS